MISIESIIENHKKKKAENPLIACEDRFGRRLIDFLTEEQMKELGFEMKEEFKGTHKPIPYTEENVLKQLKRDVEFGYEKACNHRGISSSLMFEVVKDWCGVLQNGLENWSDDDYGPYGYPLFKAVNDKYGWDVVGESPDYDDVYE